MTIKQNWLAAMIGAIILLAIVVIATIWPVVFPLAIAGAVFLILAVRMPHVVAPVLVIVSLPLMRPNVLGETQSTAALYLCIAAAVVSISADKGKLVIPRSYMVVFAMVCLLYTWILANASIFGDNGSLGSVWQGFFTTGLTVLAVGFVVADPKRRRIVVRGFVWVVIGLCASYVITLAIWLVLGFGSLPLTSFSTYRGLDGSATLFFPLTPSFGTQTVSGVSFPRFTGIGREPGWMALYCGMALLVWNRVGKPRLAGQILLAAGLLGTFSTAGFGAFVVAVMFTWLSRKSKSGDIGTQFFGLLFKLGSLGFALWLAVSAPVFGFSSKGDLNAVSLQQRADSTNAGLAAILESPLGGIHTGIQEAINLVAAIAPFGVPFVLIAAGALLLPRIGHPSKGLTNGPILLIFITVLLSQPISDSTFVFILIGLVYSVALPVSKVEAKSEVEMLPDHRVTQFR